MTTERATPDLAILLPLLVEYLDLEFSSEGKPTDPAEQKIEAEMRKQECVLEGEEFRIDLDLAFNTEGEHCHGFYIRAVPHSNASLSTEWLIAINESGVAELNPKDE